MKLDEVVKEIRETAIEWRDSGYHGQADGLNAWSDSIQGAIQSHESLLITLTAMVKGWRSEAIEHFRVDDEPRWEILSNCSDELQSILDKEA